MTNKPVLSVRSLSKSFSGKTVVDGVGFDLHPGEAIALVGENGAGKSTTKNMLCSLLRPDSGEILIDGAKVEEFDAARYGIAAVHQELSLFQTLTVSENMCISNLPGKRHWVNWNAARKKAQDQLAFLGMDVDPDTTVENLGAGQQQIIEIGKALMQAERVLILDEPTTSLTAVEREKLFNILDRLKARGFALIFISHFMEEIYRVCDTYVVLRDGKQVGEGRLAETRQSALEEMMVGRTIGETQLALGVHDDDEALSVEHFNAPDFINIDLTVRRGEIVGIAGLMGAGRTELAEAIFGLRPSTGKVFVHGKEIAKPSVARMKAAGAVYVPEDRRLNGLFLNRPVRENLSAAGIRHFASRTIAGIGFAGERSKAETVVERMNISVPHIENHVADLSGGNQQKVLLGRWLSALPEVVVFDEPTKGVDIGAKFDIHGMISEMARRKAGIVVISSDLTELLNTCHRIVVMRRGRFVGSFDRAEFDPARIISLASSAAETRDTAA